MTLDTAVPRLESLGHVIYFLIRFGLVAVNIAAVLTSVCAVYNAHSSHRAAKRTRTGESAAERNREFRNSLVRHIHQIGKSHCHRAAASVTALESAICLKLSIGHTKYSFLCNILSNYRISSADTTLNQYMINSERNIMRGYICIDNYIP